MFQQGCGESVGLYFIHPSINLGESAFALTYIWCKTVKNWESHWVLFLFFLSACENKK